MNGKSVLWVVSWCSDPLGDVIQYVKHHCVTDRRSGLDVAPGDVQIQIGSQDSEQIILQGFDFYKGINVKPQQGLDLRHTNSELTSLGKTRIVF